VKIILPNGLPSICDVLFVCVYLNYARIEISLLFRTLDLFMRMGTLSSCVSYSVLGLHCWICFAQKNFTKKITIRMLIHRYDNI
jgi:hypothetical protein